jgi:5-methyltetrahydropteroyltriglutamate--homocysteine methyltransferase
MLTQNLGYPRIGAKRELKKACENFWAGKISEKELLKAGRLERQKNWQLQKESGVDIIPCNDFSFYDHVQDMTFMLGAIPERYKPLKNILSETDLYFAMCRGYQKNSHDIIAMEMTKWFDTNYHYIVPEFVKNQTFKLQNQKVIDEFIEAKEFGVEKAKPVIIGPVSYLLLGKEKESGFNRLELINKLLPVYLEIFDKLKKNGCKYIQLDEPFLVTELTDETRSVFNYVYREFNKSHSALKIILATYFGDLGKNLELAVKLPVDTLHIDLVSGNNQLEKLISVVPKKLNLSLGIIDGRNIWENDFKKSLKIIDSIVESIGEERIWLAPSCSLLHCPYDLDLETNEKSLPPQIKNWMAFAKQKLNELKTLKAIKTKKGTHFDDALIELEHNIKYQAERKTSKLVNNIEVQQEVTKITKQKVSRTLSFKNRIIKQNKKFQFPLFPTTTIGSFPQTFEVRKKGETIKKVLLI